MKARQRILDSFRHLVLSQHWDTLTVRAVIDHAGVARSTFYSQFKDKADLLIQSLDPLLEVIAANCSLDANNSAANSAELEYVLTHFWENRSLGRVFFKPPLRDLLVANLATRLAQKGQPIGQRWFIASGVFTLMNIWITGAVSQTPANLSTQIGAYIHAIECAPFTVNRSVYI